MPGDPPPSPVVLAGLFPDELGQDEGDIAGGLGLSVVPLLVCDRLGVLSQVGREQPAGQVLGNLVGRLGVGQGDGHAVFGAGGSVPVPDLGGRESAGGVKAVLVVPVPKDDPGPVFAGQIDAPRWLPGWPRGGPLASLRQAEVAGHVGAEVEQTPAVYGAGHDGSPFSATQALTLRTRRI